jgi:hypothetical protein
MAVSHVTGGQKMKYLVQWSTNPQTTRTAVERFLKTGAKPPEGVTQLGRWFGMNGKGCSIVESDDPKGVFTLLSEWQELLDIEATPVLEDDEAGEIFSKLYG